MSCKIKRISLIHVCVYFLTVKIHVVYACEYAAVPNNKQVYGSWKVSVHRSLCSGTGKDVRSTPVWREKVLHK